MGNDYAALQARIADELARSDLTSQIQLEILSAIQHYQRQRWWFDEARSTSLSTVTNQAYLDPTSEGISDILEIVRLDIIYNGHPYKLERRNLNDFENIGGTDTALTSALPTQWAWFGDQIWFFPIPDAIYPLTLSYIKSLATLSAGADSNAWTTHGEALIRARAKAAIRVNYLNDQAAIQEMAGLSARDEPFLSFAERSAYKSLLSASAKKLAQGPLRTEFGRGRSWSILTGN